MCVRKGCDRMAQPAASKRCESCGYTTQPWDAAVAERLLNPPRSAPRSRQRAGMPVTTANEVPGWEITGYIGEVFGVVVRSRGAFPQLGAKLEAMFGGELTTMTDLLRETREQAIDRMVEEADQRGANAIVAMRFDVSSMGDSPWTEVCAYGTAVTGNELSSA
jgi:uncharacterized protein YbjQ (UPF0145 family)